MLERIVEINENHTPINEEAEFVFPDIEKMYPNVDIEEGLSLAETKSE